VKKHRAQSTYLLDEPNTFRCPYVAWLLFIAFSSSAEIRLLDSLSPEQFMDDVTLKTSV
jgi:hypothetical protein